MLSTKLNVIRNSQNKARPDGFSGVRMKTFREQLSIPETPPSKLQRDLLNLARQAAYIILILKPRQTNTQKKNAVNTSMAEWDAKFSQNLANRTAYIKKTSSTMIQSWVYPGCKIFRIYRNQF